METKSVKWAAAITTVAVVALGWLLPASCATPQEPASLEKNLVVLVRVVDGDTVDVILCRYCTLRQRLRLLQINTPERGDPGYQEATDALNKLMRSGRIRLEYETPGVPTFGRFGRRLVYVFIRGPDGREVFVNEEMIRLGHTGFWIKYGRGRYGDRLEAARPVPDEFGGCF